VRAFTFVLGSVLATVTVPVAAASAASVGPAVSAVSVCTPEHQFAIEGHVSGFPSNQQFGIALRFGDGSTAGTDFTTDATGAAVVGSVEADAAFSAFVTIWSDPDGNIGQDPGEPTVVRGLLVVDQPCTDGRFLVLATKGACKHGGWRAVVNDDGARFRNQGNCVSWAVHHTHSRAA
jgi:hypothetical protein